MPTPTMYEYTVDSDGTFPNKKVDIPSFTAQIQATAGQDDGINTPLYYAEPGGPIQIVGGNCQIWFSDVLSLSEVLALEHIIFTHTGIPVAPPPAPTLSDGTPVVALNVRQNDGTPIFVPTLPSGTEWVCVTHNYADPCTWFTESLRASNETLTDSGDGLTFNSQHVNWIDMVSGRMHNDVMWIELQQGMNPSDPHGYQVQVFVDGAPVTMRTPFAASGGAYQVLWETGQIQFFTSQAGHTVTASYSYAAGSTFYVQPRLPNTTLVLKDSEGDVSSDAVMNDTLLYTYWAEEPNGLGGLSWYELGGYEYKRSVNISVEAKGACPPTPTLGSSPAHLQLPLSEFRRVSRGMYAPTQTLPFSFETGIPIPAGAQIRISLKNDVPFGGYHVSITFYLNELSTTEEVRKRARACPIWRRVEGGVSSRGAEAVGPRRASRVRGLLWAERRRSE